MKIPQQTTADSSSMWSEAQDTREDTSGDSADESESKLVQQKNMNMDNNTKISSKKPLDYSILAPRPWRSFRDEQSSAMVVQKRKAPQPPLERVILEDVASDALVMENKNATDTEGQKKKKAPAPPIRTVSLKSPGPELDNSDDDITDINGNVDKLEDSDNGSVFAQHFSQQSGNQEFSFDAATPIFLESLKSNLELEISEHINDFEENYEYESYEEKKKDELDTVITNTEAAWTNTKELSSYEKIYDDDRGIIVNGEETVEISEQNGFEENHTLDVNVSEDGTKTEKVTTEAVKTVVMRTTTKKIDLTIRTSQIEDLDENEILKELTENGEIVNSVEETDKFDDETDFNEDDSKRKSEIILKVEELGDSINEMIENFSKNNNVPNGQSADVVLNSPPKNASNNNLVVAQPVLIAQWTHFSKGKSLVPCETSSFGILCV